MRGAHYHMDERLLRRALIVIALGGLIIGLFAWGVGRSELAWWAWAAGTGPVVAGLLISIICDFLGGEAADRGGVGAARAHEFAGGARAKGQRSPDAPTAIRENKFRRHTQRR